MKNTVRGLTAVELLVVIAIATTVGTVLFMAFSNYSRSFLRIDDRLENASKAWQIVQIIQEDILALDVPDNDLTRWREAVIDIANGCLLTRRDQNATRTVSYHFDKADHSLIRITNNESRVLIKNRCKDFVLRPEFTGETASETAGISRVFLKLELEEPGNAQNRNFEPLLIEVTLVPELLNRRLHHQYFHTGIP